MLNQALTSITNKGHHDNVTNGCVLRANNVDTKMEEIDAKDLMLIFGVRKFFNGVYVNAENLSCKATRSFDPPHLSANDLSSSDTPYKPKPALPLVEGNTP